MPVWEGKPAGVKKEDTNGDIKSRSSEVISDVVKETTPDEASGAKTKTRSLRNGRKTKSEERQQVPCLISISGSGQSDLHLGQVWLHLRLTDPTPSPAVAVQSPPSTGPAISPVVGEHIRFLVSVKFEEENVEYDVED
ncbi:Hypothetical predicted protein [Olea europaea subsp. europaea]|uniref:Uncharacterized protein n=1 Tax=Olea europaea subsp. europaea TaxID=158383 RepID=A0A8S0U6Q4_OLEEU|nr:Hypothetical predicted protein [Olea europaea subsp. europaea]